jgi:hypothetical protein
MAYVDVILWAILTVFSLSQARQWDTESSSASMQNANHIFNAIHSSMRQWGSSLNHNGMSLFLATIPKDTLLYHGTDKTHVVTGMEWLSFERQHSTTLAHLALVPGLPPAMPPSVNYKNSEEETLHSGTPQLGKNAIVQKILQSPNRRDEYPDFFWVLPGHLHTYKAKRDLHLVYIDGSSAANSPKGTLDTTDALLLADRDLEIERDDIRARRLCELASKWGSHIDGFIRMEAGFETIMCSFERSLDLVDMQRVGDIVMQAGADIVGPERTAFEWLRAATMLYDGIGGSPRRVILNYDHFITGFTYPFDPFNGDPQTAMPRLARANNTILENMRKDLNALVTDPANFVPNSCNWQDVASMIVQKYANPIQYFITSPQFNSSRQLSIALHYFARVFIDTSSWNVGKDIDRCTFEFLPRDHPPDSVAARAIYTVSNRICSTVLNAAYALRLALDPSFEDTTPEEQLESLRNLASYLAWPEWKKCKGCAWGEICSIPMFPFGIAADHEKPRCRASLSWNELFGYWNEKMKPTFDV